MNNNAIFALMYLHGEGLDFSKWGFVTDVDERLFVETESTNVKEFEGSWLWVLASMRFSVQFFLFRDFADWKIQLPNPEEFIFLYKL